MKIIFIRHAKTIGNTFNRYIGKTDEPLCEMGISMIKEKNFPECEIVISSPMKRCIETVDIIYPQKKVITYYDLRECDFGEFEGKNYYELSGNLNYQKWIDSGGKEGFPNGESPEDFKKRCVLAFEDAVEKYADYNTISFVVHGGTIMSVMERYAFPKRNYFDYRVENGCGYITEFDKKYLKIMERI